MSPNKEQMRKSISDFRDGGQPHMAAVLEEMCDRVGAPLKVVNSNDRWYMKYSWTEAEMLEFEDWMTAYLKNDMSAFREFVPSYVRKTLKHAREAAHWFTIWYGWKTRYESNKE